jgi:hypothetical protein
MQHAPKLSGVVLVKHEDGIVRILLMPRRGRSSMSLASIAIGLVA